MHRINIIRQNSPLIPMALTIRSGTGYRLGSRVCRAPSTLRSRWEPATSWHPSSCLRRCRRIGFPFCSLRTDSPPSCCSIIVACDDRIRKICGGRSTTHCIIIAIGRQVLQITRQLVQPRVQPIIGVVIFEPDNLGTTNTVRQRTTEHYDTTTVIMVNDNIFFIVF